RRVARPGATIALTTNLQGHMRELYDVFDDVLRDDEAAKRRLHDHVAHRATIPTVRELLEASRFEVTRVVEKTARMRFANGTALLNHHFIKLGFVDEWLKIAGDDALQAIAERLAGEISLTIPMAYVEATTRS
ncbi:MAG TPA: methyltransferase type 11, partial [Thermoanaerobaculia bacterium]